MVEDIGLFPSDRSEGAYDYDPKQNAIWDTFEGQVSVWDPTTSKMVVDPTLKGGFTTGDYALRYYLINGEPFFKEVHNPGTPPNHSHITPTNKNSHPEAWPYVDEFSVRLTQAALRNEPTTSGPRQCGSVLTHN